MLYSPLPSWIINGNPNLPVFGNLIYPFHNIKENEINLEKYDILSLFRDQNMIFGILVHLKTLSSQYWTLFTWRLRI